MSNTPDRTPARFSWDKIRPREYLHYIPCFDGFQCARLEVPLNWNATNRDSEPKAIVAVIRLPSKVPVTDSRYGGAIVTNPGGPGESGIHQLLTSGKHLQTIADAGKSAGRDGKFFDLISFDPRGVNNTVPRLKCFPNAATEIKYLDQLLDYSLLWSSPNVLGLEWGNAQALGESCSRKDPSTGIEAVHYVNTAQTVEDMLLIVERHGEWREAEARRLLGLSQPKILEIYELAMQRLKWTRDLEKMKYWGLSYGTTLGQTFAAMHPSRIDRMVIDGVMNAADYYAGAWMKNLVDSDKIITTYSRYCFEAGPDRCPLHMNTSVEDIARRFEDVMMDLKTNPIAMPGGDENGPALLTYKDMHLHLLGGMYSSYSHAENLFRLVAGIDARNSTIIREGILGTGREIPKRSKQCVHDGPFSDACVSQSYISMLGPNQAIACMDSAWNNSSSLTKTQFGGYLDDLKTMSKWISPSWARNKLACVGYKGKPAWTFDGPIRGNTSYPILAIGNTHDSVCPLRNAVEITHLFPSSIVVQQDSEGHCFQSSPSTCTGRIIREYFQSGKLPDNGTVCMPEYKPFVGCMNRDEDGKCKSLGEEDESIFKAIEGLT
ncbi:alpha/beta-hydrolase [Pseudovirgaria hyperparasitica]|uniref:Alpha/beta-hydrolase n=1 Tax=Pseudovirgaria hyperparasitica TaxID=470096 RepID=A0A6A6W3J4_9PEZI|nr:alpha/beta-hydrolase [Pseudovirgaria hyperparasitica]KAF2756584.1 alpha/beta-hydrolase [Pseudovirgaria hyperparasitica]